MVRKVHNYADGGKVVKRESNTMPPPEKGGTPKRITSKNPPGGAHTPGAKGKKMADGGKVYGAPTSTPAPGTTTRKRPKVGDKSSDTRLLNPRKQAAPSKPAEKPATTATVRRDYRGTKGAIDDAEVGK